MALSSKLCFPQSKLNVMPCQDHRARPGVGLTVEYSYSRGQFGYVDQKHKWRIGPHFDVATDFREGLAAVQVGHNWGYINSSGQYAIPLRFYDAGPFSEGLAPVRPFAAVIAFGFIDKSGRVVIRADYGAVRSFCDGLAAVWTDGSWGYINRKGKLVIEPKFRDAFDFSGGIAQVITEDKERRFHEGRIDKQGRLIWISPYTLQLFD